MQVMSVTGPVAAADLGPTLVHEHIIVGMPGQELDPTQAPDRREIVAIAVDKLQELKAHGVGARVMVISGVWKQAEGVAYPVG